MTIPNDPNDPNVVCDQPIMLSANDAQVAILALEAYREAAARKGWQTSEAQAGRAARRVHEQHPAKTILPIGCE